MGVTFPLLMQGTQTAQDYGAQKNYIYLIDKNGIVQAISMLPASTVSYAQIDSAVNAIAAAVPGLVGTAAKPWKRTPPQAVYSRVMSRGIFGKAEVYDVRGKLIGTGNFRASQPGFLWNGDRRPSAGKIVVVHGR